MQWWLMALSYGRAGSKIIICLLIKPNRALLSAVTQPLTFSGYSRVKFSDISFILLDHD